MKLYWTRLINGIFHKLSRPDRAYPKVKACFPNDFWILTGLGHQTPLSGSLFHCLMILVVNKCFQMSSLNLIWCSFEPSCVPRKSSEPLSLFPLFRKLKTAIKSIFNLLSYKPDKHRVVTGHAFQPYHHLCCSTLPSCFCSN